MRADLQELFLNLLERLESKKLLLNKLLQDEKTASDLIKNRNDAEDEILKIIEQQTAIIEQINVEDYYIANLRDEISRKYNIDFSRIIQNGFSTSETELINYKKEINLHNSILGEIYSLKKINCDRMKICSEDLKDQISELERMRRIKIIFPTDPRSSGF